VHVKESSLTPALFALAGVAVGLLWTVAQYFLTRKHRIQETLRTERQARYAEFIGLTDILLMKIESDLAKIKRKADALSSLRAPLGGVTSKPEDIGASGAGAALADELTPRISALADELAQEISALNVERLRPAADGLRAARVLLELVGSRAVGAQALAISQCVYEVLDALRSSDVGKARRLSGEARGARERMLEAARRDVQLD
jgi:hypothetical protein